MFIEYLFSNPIFYVRVVAILTISICLHELGHGIAALSQGDNTPSIKGHMTPNPVNPSKFNFPKWGSILVSAAGPLTNLALGFLAIILIKIRLFLTLSEIVSLDFLFLIARFNFALCLFNLLPIPPLDGFHIARELFPNLKPIGHSQIGLALFMMLFVSGIGTLLFKLADILVEVLIR